MTFDPQLDLKTKFFVLYLDAQMKVSRMAKLLKMSERTLRDWIQKTNENKDIRITEEGRGAKSTITKSLEDKIVRRVREAPQKASTRSLGDRYGVNKNQVHSILKKRKFEYKSTEITQELTPQEKNNRIKFCNDMLNKDGEKLDQVFFSDEMGIRLSDATLKKAWGDPYKKVKVEKPKKDVKLNCWGAISVRGATTLHIFSDNLKKQRYQNILEEHIPEMQALYPEGFLFQQDKHSAHQACQKWMDDNNIQRVLFPTYSPDLTPIENLWGALKHSVRCDGPRNEAELKASLQRNWEILTTTNNLTPYFETLTFRYNACIENNGARLPY